MCMNPTEDPGRVLRTLGNNGEECAVVCRLSLRPVMVTENTPPQFFSLLSHKRQIPVMFQEREINLSLTVEVEFKAM